MDPVTVITGLTAAIQLAEKLYEDYQAGKVVLSLQDAQAIKAQLIQAQEMTAKLTPLVDAALEAAASR